MAHKEPHPDHDLIQGEWTEKTLVEKLLEPVEKPAPKPWKVVLAVGGGPCPWPGFMPSSSPS